MKKIWLIMLSVILAAGLSFTGCETELTGFVEVIFNAGDGEFSGGLGIRKVVIDNGGTVTPPDDPELFEHDFLGWASDPSAFTVTLSPNTTHTSRTTYYAVYEQNVFDVTNSWTFGNPHRYIEPGVSTWDFSNQIMQALGDADGGSRVRLYFTSAVNPASWSIGSIGTATDKYENDLIGLRVRDNNMGLTYFIELEVNWVIDTLTIAENASVFTSGSNLIRLELLEPKPGKERLDTPRPGAPALPVAPITDPPVGGGELLDTINIHYGFFGDRTLGKGDIEGAELQKIKDAVADLDLEDERIMLRVYVRNNLNLNRSSWGIGMIGDTVGFTGAGANGDKVNNLNHASVLSLLALNKPLSINIYNNHVITKIELWKVPYVALNVTLVNSVSGDTIIGDIDVNGRNAEVVVLADKSGYTMSSTGGGAGNRGKYAWFALDFGEKRLSNFKEIKFTYQLRNDPPNNTRRFGLLAQSFPYEGNLDTHQTRPTDSGVGYLAAYQVTEAIAASTSGSTFTPVEMTLKILPQYAGTLDADALLYLCLYEHTSAGGSFIISNIRFIERVPGECDVCGPPTVPCDCNEVLAAAKTAIEDATHVTSTASLPYTAANASTAVSNLINGLSLDQVTAVVQGGAFTAPTEDVPGTFAFTVVLSRGNGTPVTTASRVLTINAEIYVPPTLGPRETLIFDMQMSVSEYNHAFAFPVSGNINSSNSNLFHSNTGTVAANMSSNPKTLQTAGKGGTGQGLRMSVSAIAAKADHHYRLEYGGTFPVSSNAGETPRFRAELSPTTVILPVAEYMNITDRQNPTLGAPVLGQAGGSFIVSYTLTPAQMTQFASTTISFGNTNDANLQILFTTLRIIEIEPPSADEQITETVAALEAHNWQGITISAVNAAAASTAVVPIINSLRTSASVNAPIAATPAPVFVAALGAVDGYYEFYVNVSMPSGTAQNGKGPFRVTVSNSVVLYNMATDANLTRFNGNSQALDGQWIFTSQTGTATANLVDGTLSFGGPIGGTSQGFRIRPGAFNTTFNVTPAKAGYKYRFEYSATTGNNTSIAQFRHEAGTGNTPPQTVLTAISNTNNGTGFVAVYELTAEQLIQWATANVAYIAAGMTPAPSSFTYTKFVVTEIAP